MKEKKKQLSQILRSPELITKSCHASEATEGGRSTAVWIVNGDQCDLIPPVWDIWQYLSSTALRPLGQGSRGKRW